MSAATFGLDAALEEFAQVWSDPYLYDDIGTALACREADALASVLRELGKPDAADALIEAHAEGDDERGRGPEESPALDRRDGGAGEEGEHDRRGDRKPENGAQ